MSIEPDLFQSTLIVHQLKEVFGSGETRTTNSRGAETTSSRGIEATNSGGTPEAERLPAANDATKTEDEAKPYD